MKPMQHVMIHNVQDKLFNLDLNNYRLTFDDGLFSQYYYFPKLKQFSDTFIFFITTSFIQDGKSRGKYGGTELPYVKSKNYMYDRFVLGKKDHFMKSDEVKWLAGQKGVTIGAHSHFHDIILTSDPLKKKLSPWKLFRCPAGEDSTGFNRRSKLAFQGYVYENGRLIERTDTQWMDYIRYDTESALDWFEKKLGIFPESYCFPFNEYNEKLLNSLKSFGFKHFYNGRPGSFKEVIPRIDIDRLL
jgi:hypothetical protein